MLRAVALLLTVFTGFSGLVYEVTWQKYVATLLGSHSEATAAVLGIFLAGLSAGYSIFGEVTRRQVQSAQAAGRSPRLLRTYGIIEAGIGLYALGFPWLFEAVRSISYAIPHDAAGVGFAFDVLLVALLLGPPTILMGGTIPILTQALSKDLEDATRFHALVYSLNTAGAFGGALAGSFLLIPKLGLVGVLYCMSAINLVAGGVFLLLGRRQTFVASGEPQARAQTAAAPEGFAAYAAVAMLSGFSMMVIQNVAIRVGGLSLGSSEHTFGMVVAVFVLCIAIGSFFVSLFPQLPSRTLVVNQGLIAMLVAALYLPMHTAPYWAFRVRMEFGAGPDDFLPYYLANFVAILLVLGPFAILSGATLPLLFHHLRQQVGDLGLIAGRLYSWNTFGSLLGALLGGFVLLLFLDLHHVYRIAGSALVVNTGLLALCVLPRIRREVVIALVLVSLTGLWLLPAWNPTYLSLGLFRNRTPVDGSLDGIEELVRRRASLHGRQVIYYDDDPTVSVTVMEAEESEGRSTRALLSNGKPDGDSRGDYPTMALAGLIPAMMADKLERSFVIGLGTGVTVGELASIDGMREVKVAEISPAVINAAPLFDFANGDVSTNPKVQMIRSDAYRALMRSSGKFDVIVSEPSNPWVSGVEMLYSREFLSVARQRLAEGGVYCQWFHQYESDAASVELVLRTFASAFDRVAIWYGLGPDLFILGFEDSSYEPQLSDLREKFARPDLRAGFKRSRVKSLPALLSHELIPVGVVAALDLQGPIQSLYRPLLNHLAGLAFFRGKTGHLPRIRSGTVAKLGADRSLLRGYLKNFSGEQREIVQAKAVAEACVYRRDLCAVLLASWEARAPESETLADVRRVTIGRVQRHGGPIDRDLLTRLAMLFGPAERERTGKPPQLRDLRSELLLYLNFFQFAAPFNADYLVSRWEQCTSPAAAGAACERGLKHAKRLRP